jgi:hypothetical protein
MLSRSANRMGAHAQGLGTAQSKMRRFWLTLFRPMVGVCCALFTAVWCGLGSALDRWAPNFHHRHVAAFMGAPRWHGVWMFVLLGTISLWCIQAIARLQVTWVHRKQPGMTSKHELALRTVVLAIVLVLCVYVGFVIAAPSEQFAVTTQETNIHGELYRTLRLESLASPERIGQSPTAWLERRNGAATDTMRVERGKWWTSRVASYELALARGSRHSAGAVFRLGRQKMTLDIDKPVRHGLRTFLLRALGQQGSSAASNSRRAELEVNGKKASLPLDPEWAGSTAFLGQKESPVVVLRVHRRLSAPLACLAIILVGLTWCLWKLESRLAARKNS